MVARRGEPIATLSSWAHDVWLALLDRDGSYFGRLAEEGTFQRFNPLMDDEYELDVWTGLFTGAEDARWAPVRTGLRAAGASISHPLLLNVAEWRQDVGIAGPVVFVPRFVRQHSLSSRRDYFAVALEWRGLGDPRWALRGGFGVHAFKASGDVEFALTRRRVGETGLAAEVRVALLDAFNNVVFDLARDRPEQAPTHFQYRALPRAARLDVEWVTPHVRVELRAGASTRSRVEVTFPVTGDTSFTQAEDVRYAGALVQLDLTPRVSLALSGTAARAATDRRFDGPSARDFDLLEETSGVGGRARFRVTRTAAIELDGRVLWRPERRKWGDGTAIRHDDREIFAQAVVTRRPPLVGWLWRFGVAYLDRRAGVMAPQLEATNARSLAEFGYRFASAFEAVFGARWDLDGAGTFDGGHLRLSATW